MEQNKIYLGDCLEVMKELPENSVDLIFTDPPYALGSEIIIKQNGKPDYKKAQDFMNKWDMPTGEFWEEWFWQANRILKHGGHCLVFGIDRQNMMSKYYSALAGFTSKQSLYWYFISSFPKAVDLSRMIDKNAGAEREVIGQKEPFGREGRSYGINEEIKEDNFKDITKPATHLAQKYEGYKYSVAPLKQTCEEIMVFQKEYKTKSCLHDVLKMENGDNEITCGCLNIDDNRVPVLCEKDNQSRLTGFKGRNFDGNVFTGSKTVCIQTDISVGRFPSQTFIDDDIAEKLDLQSGIKKSKGSDYNFEKSEATVTAQVVTNIKSGVHFSDSGGCSKIHHKCNYEKNDFDLFVYCSKVSNKERNMGCENLEKKHRAGSEGSKVDSEIELDDLSERFRTTPAQNNHPTVKPIKLLKHILSLFKTPNEQLVLDSFMGSGSIGMACKDLDMDYLGIELNPEYFEIAKARIENYACQDKEKQLNLFEVENGIE